MTKIAMFVVLVASTQLPRLARAQETPAAAKFPPVAAGVALPPAPAAAAAAPTAPVESDSDLKKLLEAYGNTTQLKVAQGGTLGMPRQGITNGVQANVDAHFGGDSVSPDVLASYGGLELSDNLNADVFAEIVDQDVPRLVLGGTTIDHKPTTQKLSTGGVRIQWTFGISNWCAKGADVENVSTKDSHSAIIKALKGRGTKQGNCDKLIGLTTHSVSAGLRIIRRSGLSADSPSATGGSFEVLYQYDKNTTKHGLGLFVGVSGMAMNPTSETLGSTTTQFPKFSLLRPTAGVDGQAREGRRQGARGQGSVHRAAGAAHDTDAPFVFRQGAHRERDHQRVIPRQQQVDQDEGKPAQYEVHAAPVQALARRK